MNLIKRSQQVLLVILLLNLISTWLHYTDNALFLDQYSGPEWFTTSGVFIAVTVMTPIGLLGCWLYTKGMLGLSYLLLCMYSITSISSPGHYPFSHRYTHVLENARFNLARWRCRNPVDLFCCMVKPDSPRMAQTKNFRAIVRTIV